MDPLSFIIINVIISSSSVTNGDSMGIFMGQPLPLNSSQEKHPLH